MTVKELRQFLVDCEDEDVVCVVRKEATPELLRDDGLYRLAGGDEGFVVVDADDEGWSADAMQAACRELVDGV